MLANEPLIRLGAFAGIFILMLLLELLWPRRELRFDRLMRWPGNLGITMVNTFVVRLLFPAAAVGYALTLEAEGKGLLNSLQFTGPLAVFTTIVVLDFCIWAQHLLFHRVPLLWSLHRMHHTDNDIDVTTGARFHPLEIVASMLIKLALIRVLGPPAAGVLLFEVLLNGCAMFNHANFALPKPIDRLLRVLIVTPDMHRVHHSTVRAETDSNFGFCLSIWDRVFKTYIAQPEGGHEGMTIGLPGSQSQEAQRIDRMLADPFRDQASR